MNVYFFETAKAVPYRKGMKKEFLWKEEGGLRRIFIPLDIDRLKEKQKEELSGEIISYGNIRFASDELKGKLSGCFSESDGKNLFDRVGILAARKLCEKAGVRCVIYGADLKTALFCLESFPNLALSGEGALKTSNEVYEMTGAAVPVVSGAGEEDVVFLRSRDKIPESFLRVGFDLEGGEGVINRSSFKFTGSGRIGTLCRLLKRSLTIEEAEILSEIGEKPSFILC